MDRHRLVIVMADMADQSDLTDRDRVFTCTLHSLSGIGNLMVYWIVCGVGCVVVLCVL